MRILDPVLLLFSFLIFSLFFFLLFLFFSSLSSSFLPLLFFLRLRGSKICWFRLLPNISRENFAARGCVTRADGEPYSTDDKLTFVTSARSSVVIHGGEGRTLCFATARLYCVHFPINGAGIPRGFCRPYRFRPGRIDKNGIGLDLGLGNGGKK